MTPRIAMLIVAVLGLTLAFAQDGADEAREVDIAGGEPPAEKACFNVRQARNFSALDDRHVYLEAPRNKHFLLTMVPGCFGLEGSLQISDLEQLEQGLLGRLRRDHVSRLERRSRNLPDTPGRSGGRPRRGRTARRVSQPRQRRVSPRHGARPVRRDCAAIRRARVRP